MRYEIAPGLGLDTAPGSDVVALSRYHEVDGVDGGVIVIPHGRPSWLRLSHEALEVARAVDGRTVAELRSLPSFPAIAGLLEKLFDAGLLFVGDRTGIRVVPTSTEPSPAEPPRSLLLKMTGACDMACDYCYDYDRDRWHGRLDMDVARRLIAECLLPKRRLTIMFHGGEPFLQFSKMKQVVEFATEEAARRDATVHFNVQTNGLHFTDEVVDFLKSHPFGVGVSLDGPQELHDRMRVDHRGRGTFDRIAASFDRHPEFMRENVGYITVVTPENVSELERTWRFFRELGALTWKLIPVEPEGRGSEIHEDEGFRRSFIDYLHTRLDAIEAGDIEPPFVFNVTQLIAPFMSVARKNMCMKMPCGAGTDLMVLDAVGSVRACDCSYHPAFMLAPRSRVAKVVHAGGDGGSTGDGAARLVDTAYASPTGAQLRQRERWLQDEAPCASCPWLHHCAGTCPARALMRKGTLFAVDDLECATRLELFPRILPAIADDDSPVRAYYDSMSRSVSRPVDPYNAP
jgi:uncharacterized protein